jgi:hypothetical protein
MFKKPLKSGFFMPGILANAGIHFDCHSGGGQNLGKVYVEQFHNKPTFVDTILTGYQPTLV